MFQVPNEIPRKIRQKKPVMLPCESGDNLDDGPCEPNKENDIRVANVDDVSKFSKKVNIIRRKNGLAEKFLNSVSENSFKYIRNRAARCTRYEKEHFEIILVKSFRKPSL